MSKIVVTLDQEDLLELQRVLMDSDEPGALEFLKDRMVSKIPVKGTAACDSTRLNPCLLRPEPNQSRAGTGTRPGV